MLHLFTLVAHAQTAPVDQLDARGTTVLIALLILSLIAAIVNGAYALYMRRKACMGPDVRKRAMRVWQDRKEELRKELVEELEKQVKTKTQDQLRKEVAKKVSDELGNAYKKEEIKLIDDLGRRIDKELEELKREIKSHS